uniref:VP10 n=1 Tax=Tarumizu tick virus TaxID=2014339 RepID=A0A2C9DXR7_9REOV|nr:VP10 [Tarumizu tick virus]
MAPPYLIDSVLVDAFKRANISSRIVSAFEAVVPFQTQVRQGRIVIIDEKDISQLLKQKHSAHVRFARVKQSVSYGDLKTYLGKDDTGSYLEEQGILPILENFIASQVKRVENVPASVDNATSSSLGQVYTGPNMIGMMLGGNGADGERSLMARQLEWIKQARVWSNGSLEDFLLSCPGLTTRPDHLIPVMAGANLIGVQEGSKIMIYKMDVDPKLPKTAFPGTQIVEKEEGERIEKLRSSGVKGWVSVNMSKQAAGVRSGAYLTGLWLTCAYIPNSLYFHLNSGTISMAEQEEEVCGLKASDDEDSGSEAGSIVEEAHTASLSDWGESNSKLKADTSTPVPLRSASPVYSDPKTQVTELPFTPVEFVRETTVGLINERGSREPARSSPGVQSGVYVPPALRMSNLPPKDQRVRQARSASVPPVPPISSPLSLIPRDEMRQDGNGHRVVLNGSRMALGPAGREHLTSNDFTLLQILLSSLPHVNDPDLSDVMRANIIDILTTRSC